MDAIKDFVNMITNQFKQEVPNSPSVGIIDTNLAFDHAYALSKGMDVYYQAASSGAFPSIGEQISGDGFKKIIKSDDWGSFKDKVDFLLFTDCYFGAMADVLRGNGLKVFGPSKYWTDIENDRVFGWKELQKMDVGVPKGVVIHGLEQLLQLFREQPDSKGILVGHKNYKSWMSRKKYLTLLKSQDSPKPKVYYIKISKYRGSRETGSGMATETEALVSLTQAGFGPYLTDLEMLVQEACPGVEVGFDAFFNGKEFIRPFLYTIEVKGEGTIGLWVESNGIEQFIFDKIKPSLMATNYRGNISFEFFYDGKQIYAHDPTSRLPFPCSSIQAHFITNIDEVYKKVAMGENVKVEIKDGKKYASQVGIYTDDDDTWRTIRFPDEHRNRMGFRRVVIRDNDYWFVPGDPVVATANGQGSTPKEALDNATELAGMVECSNINYPAGFEEEILGIIKELNELSGEKGNMRF